MTRRRFLKTAVPDDEYAAICRRADAEGLRLSGYLRAAVARDVERATTGQILADIRAALMAQSGSGASVTPDALLAVIEPALAELLLLQRFIATRADVQEQARITAAINVRYPERKIK